MEVPRFDLAVAAPVRPAGKINGAASCITYQPITVKGLQEYSVDLWNIYFPDALQATGKKIIGVTIRTLYQAGNDYYLGKVNFGTGLLDDDPDSIRKATRKDLGLAAILEKISYDFYKELGRGFFNVPASFLSLQPIKDAGNLVHSMALSLEHVGVNSCLRILSRYPAIPGYQDFSKATTQSRSGSSISFVQYVQSYHSLPESLYAPDGLLKPIWGLVELLAVMRAIADTDGLGGRADNAGFVWVEDDQGQIIAAQTVKIDPGAALSFKQEDKDKLVNFVFNKKAEAGPPQRWVNDLRDVQTANNDPKMIIHWEELPPEQKSRFISTLLNCLRYKQNEGVADLLIHRQGKFDHSPSDQLPKNVSDQLRQSLQDWLHLQEEIYAQELHDFQVQYPEIPLRMHYIDHWGQLSLPMVDETFPVRELFTELALASEEKQVANSIDQTSSSSSSSSSFAAGSSQGGLLRDRQEEHSRGYASQGNSSASAYGLVKARETAAKRISLKQLFETETSEPIRRVLLTGDAGVGKSTLCQKIAHDWASGLLFEKQFKAVYWIPLRMLNTAVEAGGALHAIQDSDLFLARALAEFVLQQPRLVASFLQQLQNNRQEILVLFDGYDEASEALVTVLSPVLSDTELHVFLTSRPGVTARLTDRIHRSVENLGFADDHVENYCEKFFSRKGDSLQSRQTQQNFLHALKAQTYLSQMGRVPLNLQMLCSLWEQGADRAGFGRTKTELYFTMTEQFLLWQCQKQSVDPQKLDPSKKNKLYDLLGLIGLHGLSQERLIISQAEVQSCLQGKEITEQELLDSGLLKVAGSGPNTYYQFLHLTFQEYLIAQYLSRKGPEEQKIFIQNYASKPSFALVMTFLAGEIYRTDLSDNKEAMQLFFENLCDGVNDLPGELHKAPWELPLHCLNECPNYSKEIPKLLACVQKHPTVFISDNQWQDHFPVAHWMAQEGLTYAIKWLVAQQGPGAVSVTDPRGRSLLYCAAAGGDLELLQWLYEQDPTLIQKTKKGGVSALYIAAGHGHLPAMEWLCQKDPNLLLKTTDDGMTTMHWAAQNGHLPAMQWLDQKDASLVSKPANDGFTTMHWAAQNGHLPAMQWLHQKDASLVSKPTNIGATTMHWAALNGHLLIMEWLHQKDASLVSKLTNTGGTTMHWAAEKGHLLVMEWLHQQDERLVSKPTNDGATTMHWAALNGHLLIMEWLHQQHASLVSKTNNDGETPMHWTARNGHLPVMEWLHQQDASLVSKTNNDGETPMHLAAQKGHLPVVEWLYQQDASSVLTASKNGAVAMHHAAFGGHLLVIQWLYQKALELLPESPGGHNAMHCAAEGGHLPVMEWLHQEDASLVSKLTKAGGTTMHLAAEHGHLPVMEWLHQKDAGLVSKLTKAGGTTMHTAAGNGHLPAMEWLHQKDPSLLQKAANEGSTAIDCAAKGGHLPAMEWLYQKTGKGGTTVMHQAAQDGRLSLMKWLYQNDPSSTQNRAANGETAMHYAAKGGHLPVMEWLYEQDPALVQNTRTDGATTMHSAAHNGQLEVMEWLHQKDPSLIYRTWQGLNFADFVAKNGTPEALRWLHEKDPALRTKNSKCIIA